MVLQEGVMKELEIVTDCPECGSKDTITTRNLPDRFQFGDGIHHEQVWLECVVPFRRCSWCGFEFTDWEAEEIRDLYVREWLKANPEKKRKEKK